MPIAAFVALVVCAAPASPTPGAPKMNPALAPWPGRYGGVPPFDTIKVEHLGPALDEGMALMRKEIEAIATAPSQPTFENTLAALERAGQPLTRASTVFGVFSSSLSSPEFRKIEAEYSPKLAAFQDSIVQNAKLFARIKAVYEARANGKLSKEQQRLAWVTYLNFERQGATLSEADKATLTEYNQQLATLTTQFSQNQLGDEENLALTIDKQADLAGLSEAQIAALSAEAERRGQKGKWVVANTRSSMEPFLTFSSQRALREKAFRIWTRRGDNGDERDNNALVTKILALRAKKAKLLGYPTYAHWKLSDQMAKKPETALELMLSVWKPALAAFKQDVADAQIIADAEGGKFKLEAWDYRYYAEKLRKKKYDLDLNEVKPYLQLEKIREAMFWVAKALYGFTFVKVQGLPVFDPNMSVFEVKGSKGEHVGLWYFDPYARPGKQSGAWMNAYRDQRRLDSTITPIVSNNSNFVAGAPNEPVTISWDDARTMFHEFGHALHGLNSNVTYPSLAGTSTTRDFVEFPSQFHENFLTTPQVLKFLVNQKGEPIPPSLVERILKAQTFNAGFATAEAQASAIVDMKLHLAGDVAIDPKAFEKSVLTELGMPPQLVMRHRIPAFGHLFSGDGYAAGYYSYLWSEVLEQDAFEAFRESGNPYDAKIAKRFREAVMSVGNTIDPAEAFRNFRGRDPKPEALLRSKGFPVVGEK